MNEKLKETNGYTYAPEGSTEERQWITKEEAIELQKTKGLRLLIRNPSGAIIDALRSPRVARSDAITEERSAGVSGLLAKVRKRLFELLACDDEEVRLKAAVLLLQYHEQLSVCERGE